MNEAQHHSFLLVVILTVTLLGLLSYRMLKPDQRPETLQLAISRCLLLTTAFAVSAFVMGFETENYRLQALAVAPVNFAIVMVVASICTLQARSLGTVDISPRARQLLRNTPHVFLICFGANLAMSMIWPVPVLDRFSIAPPYYLLNRAFVTVAETFFLAVAAFLSWQAAGRHEPVRRIRTQHVAFFGGQVLLVCTALNTYLIVCFRVFVANDVLRESLIKPALVRESWLVAGAVMLYMIGFSLYYTNNERTRTITRFSKWRRVRQQLDQAMWLVESEEPTDRLAIYESLPDAARELIERAAEENREQDFCPEDIQKALSAFKMFVIAAKQGTSWRSDSDLLGSALRYQQSMLREPLTSEVSWHIASAPTALYDYSIAADLMNEPLKKVWEFLRTTRKPQLLGEPEWFQLAVVSAADAGILEQEQTIMDRVWRAYNNACLATRISRNYLSP